MILKWDLERKVQVGRLHEEKEDIEKRMDEILDEKFIKELALHGFQDDQLYNVLYFLLYFSAGMDFYDAFYEAAVEGCPFVADSGECRFVRKLVVMLLMADIDLRRYIADKHGLLKQL